MKLLVLTGAGISAESGVPTFRDAGGLWAKYSIDEVCTPLALQKNPQKVLSFYNMRRRECAKVEPNDAHLILKQMESEHDVTIVTTNVDNLHEKAGSSTIYHIHGELNKARDMVTEDVYDWTEDINVGTLSLKGNQLRPHIVFFFEQVPMIIEIEKLIKENVFDALIVIGSSLEVYPAATILDMVKDYTKTYLIDIKEPKRNPYNPRQYMFLQGTATEQLPILRELLKGQNA
jgi:NAD-dependent deacetylase